MNKYTSLKLSKLLTDNGFEGECDNSQDSFGNLYDNGLKKKVKAIRELDLLPSYDILNDLCVKYAKEMFGERRTCWNCQSETFFEEDGKGNKYETCDCDFQGKLEVETDLDIRFCSMEILFLLQQNKKDKAEEYLWEHCLFNKNKL